MYSKSPRIGGFRGHSRIYARGLMSKVVLKKSPNNMKFSKLLMKTYS
jgi:hypothetical protein